MQMSRYLTQLPYRIFNEVLSSMQGILPDSERSQAKHQIVCTCLGEVLHTVPMESQLQCTGLVGVVHGISPAAIDYLVVKQDLPGAS